LKNITIELQHFHGCPNSPILIERVNEAIRDLENVDYVEVLVDSNEKAEEIKFRGSPTLLINGIDFEEREQPETASLNCRVYQNGLPTSQQIINKILKIQQGI
jgi:protein tyrosine phosphatase (PTP) superfamily phosphohydrolase (DUF442 family)